MTDSLFWLMAIVIVGAGAICVLGVIYNIALLIDHLINRRKAKGKE